jgi:hypothetical protein
MEGLRLLFNRPTILPERHDERFVPGRTQKFHQVGARKAGRAGIDERMEVESFMPHHRLVEDDANLAGFVIDRPERRDRARPDALYLFQEFGRAERDPPLGADLLVYALEVNDRLLSDNEQEQPALLVLDEQVLGVSPRDIAAQHT